MPSIQLVICMQLAQEKKKRIPVDVLYSLNYAFFFNTWQKRVCTIIVKILCSFRSLQEQYYFFAFFI